MPLSDHPELPDFGEVPFQRSPRPRIDPVVAMKAHIDMLQDQLRDATFMMAAVIAKYGGRIEVTEKDITSAPKNGVMHVQTQEDGGLLLELMEGVPDASDDDPGQA